MIRCCKQLTVSVYCALFFCFGDSLKVHQNDGHVSLSAFPFFLKTYFQLLADDFISKNILLGGGSFRNSHRRHHSGRPHKASHCMSLLLIRQSFSVLHRIKKNTTKYLLRKDVYHCTNRTKLLLSFSIFLVDLFRSTTT